MSEVWRWGILAVLLLIGEILAPGVFFLWIAFGAAIAAVAAFLAPGLGWETHGLIMAAASVGGVILGRRLYEPRRSAPSALNRRADRHIGETATLEESIIDGAGRIRLGGSHWTVRGADLPAGAKVTIVGADGTTLRVEPVREAATAPSSPPSGS
jgi:membrane protein implicated in regulation of membrane protease activity